MNAAALDARVTAVRLPGVAEVKRSAGPAVSAVAAEQPASSAACALPLRASASKPLSNMAAFKAAGGFFVTTHTGPWINDRPVLIYNMKHIHNIKMFGIFRIPRRKYLNVRNL